jgi:hypothetical protein
MTLDWEHIAEIIESRGHTGFPTLECEENFFSHQAQIQSTTQPITYEQLMRENFENKSAPLRAFFDNVMEHCSVDVLAYYLPFHGNGNWGIYILDAGVDMLANTLIQLSDHTLLRPDAEYLAKHNLLLHELGHHAVEIVHTSLEIDPNNPVPGSYRSTRLPVAQAQRFHENEEAVCNRSVKWNKSEFEIRALSHFDVVSDFMLRQPRGYNRFGEITNSNLLENILDTRLTGPLQPETCSNLEKEFFTHSKLPRVRPGSIIGFNNPIGFVVPIYLIRT